MTNNEKRQHIKELIAVIVSLTFIYCCTRSGINHTSYQFDDDREESEYMSYLCVKEGDEGVILTPEEDFDIDYNDLGSK